MAITLRNIAEDDLEMIMNWRMAPEVTKWMNTDPKLTIEGQEEWLKKIRIGNSCRYWMIVVDNEPAGVIHIINIDKERKRCSWGYYIGNKELSSLKLVLNLEWSLYEYVLKNLDFDYLDNEPLSINKGVISLHQRCGSKIIRTEKNAVEKNGIYYDVVHMTITKEEWLEKKIGIHYDKIDFEV